MAYYCTARDTYEAFGMELPPSNRDALPMWMSIGHSLSEAVMKLSYTFGSMKGPGLQSPFDCQMASFIMFMRLIESL